MWLIWLICVIRRPYILLIELVGISDRVDLLGFLSSPIRPTRRIRLIWLVGLAYLFGLALSVDFWLFRLILLIRLARPA